MSKASMCAMADYILSGGHEESNCIEKAQELLEAEGSKINRSQMRKFMQDHIFYKAYRARYGANDANKQITEMMGELDFKKFPMCEACFAINNKGSKTCQGCSREL